MTHSRPIRYNGPTAADSLTIINPLKEIKYTQHARDRMHDANRGLVYEADVEQVLANPTASYIGVDGKQNVLGESGGKRIRVRYIEEENRLLIITVINRGRE